MTPLVIAHRGYSSVAPENTLSAFRLGWEAGADGIECDVHLTADGEVVCIHDFDTDRVGDQSCEIAETDWETLRSIDVGAWKGEKWRGEPIPKLSDAIAASPEPLLWIVEVKCGPEIVPPLLDVIDGSGRDERSYVVISFNRDSLVELKRVRPSVKAYWLSHFKEISEGVFEPSVETVLDTVESLGVDGFGGESGAGISRLLTESLTRRGWELNVWTVDDPTEALRMRAIGATSVTTNDPARIREALINS